MIELKLENIETAIGTDNARNMLLAGVEAEMHSHVRCITHTLNMALQVKGVGEVLVQVRKVVSYFYRSPRATEMEKQEQLSLPAHKLVQDVFTRWNSSLGTLQRF